jgi:hypothetical protein
VTFLVSTRLPARVRDEIRIACDESGVEAVDFVDGMAIPPATVAVVAALPPGARRIPPDLARLASRAALRLVLCAAEPMLRPVTSLLGGRVILIAPPFDPKHLRWGLRAAAASGVEPVQLTGDAGQALSPEWWLAWARQPGHEGGLVAAESTLDVTAVIGAACTPAQAEQASDLIRAATDDEALERDLTAMVEDRALVRLAATLGEWMVYVPPRAGALWLCSPWRAPAQWCLSKAITEGGHRVARVPAYPHDVMILCDQAAVGARMAEAAEQGALEAYEVLRTAAADSRLLGAVLEAR